MRFGARLAVTVGALLAGVLVGLGLPVGDAPALPCVELAAAGDALAGRAVVDVELLEDISVVSTEDFHLGWLRLAARREAEALGAAAAEWVEARGVCGGLSGAG